MTTFTATTVRLPRLSSTWVIAILAIAVAGLTAALIVSLTSGSAAPAAPQAPAQTTVHQSTGGAGLVAPGTGRLCNGSVKDWTC